MKTIDVMEGDEFVADEYLCQTRGGMFRNFWAGGVSGWSKGGRLAENPKLRPVSTDDALLMLTMAGYTITPGEGEKPAAKTEAKPMTFMDDLVERTEKPAPTVKPDVTVPLVDAVWVEVTTRGGVKYLNTYPSPEEALKVWGDTSGQRMEEGLARIVRIRPDADAIKADVTVAVQRINAQYKWLEELESRLDTLSDLTAARDARLVQRLEKVESIANCKGIFIPAEKPADKDAARVVKAPKLPKAPAEVCLDWDKGQRTADEVWRTALASQGIKVEAAE